MIIYVHAISVNPLFAAVMWLPPDPTAAEQNKAQPLKVSGDLEMRLTDIWRRSLRLRGHQSAEEDPRERRGRGSTQSRHGGTRGGRRPQGNREQSGASETSSAKGWTRVEGGMTSPAPDASVTAQLQREHRSSPPSAQWEAYSRIYFTNIVKLMLNSNRPLVNPLLFLWVLNNAAGWPGGKKKSRSLRKFLK